MFLTVTNPFGKESEPRPVDSGGHALGYLLRDKEDAIEGVVINGRIDERWRDYTPKRGDHVNLLVKTSDPFIGILIGLVVNLAISAIIRALTPSPKKPKQGRRSEAFGIAGLNNTTGPGTPKFVPYGENRIFGHVIASGAEISDDGREMHAKILYFMGDTGGDGIDSINDIEIDEAGLDQYPEITPHIRLGFDDQAVVPEFENVEQLLNVQQTLEFNNDTGEGSPHVYTTRADTVEQSTLFFNFPGGLYRLNDSGSRRDAFVRIKIEEKLNSDPVENYQEVSGSEISYRARDRSEFFRKFVITHPSAGKWDIRVRVMDRSRQTSAVNTIVLYNVQETQFTALNYGGDAVLGLTGIPARRVRSLEAMKCSALVKGKRVKVPDGEGGYNLIFTRKRCWIIRDMMTHPRVGMGEIGEDEIDDEQWAESQAYYDEMVNAMGGGSEVRDLCDVIVNESRWDWEWIVGVAGEARGRIIPVGDKWHYLIDRPGDPQLLYAEPGNIIEGTMQIEIGPPDRVYNQIIAEYRDDTDGDVPDISTPISVAENGVITYGEWDTAEQIIQESRQYDSIRRESEVLRENLIELKRMHLERRRWVFTSPPSALPSIPLDIDWVAERDVGGEGAYAGFLPPQNPAAPTKIVLPETVTLEAGKDYAIIVKHIGDNTTEQRDVTTGAGSWGEIEIDSAFAELPSQGQDERGEPKLDIFSLGELNVDHIMTRLHEWTLDNEGRINQVRAEYIPSIYTDDALPPRQARRRFNLLQYPPIPLRAANVSEELATTRDGSKMSILTFDVTPGMPRHSGTAQGGSVNHIRLAAIEPARAHYFRGAIVRIVAETGAGQERKIISYDANRDATVNSPFDTAPDATSIYEIEWDRFGEFDGFRVEISDELDGDFASYGETRGTYMERSGSDQRGVRFFRFTPIGVNGMDNQIAPIVIGFELEGDTSAPAPPASVVLTGHIRNVNINIFQNRPTAEDLAGFEVDYWRDAIGGGGTFLRLVQVPVEQDSAESGQMRRVHTEHFGDVPYGTFIFARARAFDRSGNKSAYVAAGAGVELKQVDTGDVQPNSLQTIVTFVNDAQISGGSTFEIGSVTITTVGGSVRVLAKATLENELTNNITSSLSVRRGATFAGGINLDTVDVFMVPDAVLTAPPLIGIDHPPAGTHQYKLWHHGAPDTFAVTRRRLFVDENRNGILS